MRECVPQDGKEIIDALITNSKTFQNKTQFSQVSQAHAQLPRAGLRAGAWTRDAHACSPWPLAALQEKYKRKKAKKYLTVVTVRRPTGRYISQVSAALGTEEM